ncbi:proteinase [Neokomagataea thailandica NBRC 106555]|uniref:Peptidase S53 n=2 Tax=Neokomagataea TaxID=1223423 RepID=A0A4Y6VAG5_9PROT|nr:MULTISPECIES: S53 family peptidase [Neokomagataea]QDH25457.1 peptidase S53 [Neokomagataea tanensis]GBR50772.1 proteinase [Neokomagataea thailandica NBRC 106555]
MQKAFRNFLAYVGLIGAGVHCACAASVGTDLKTSEVAPANAAVHFDVTLPLRDSAGLSALVQKLHDPSSPEYHHWLKPSEVLERFGPSPYSLAKAKAALLARGFNVEQEGRTFHITGRAAHVSSTLATSLKVKTLSSGQTHLYTAQKPSLPTDLGDGAILTGLSAHEHVAHPFLQHVKLPASVNNPLNRYSTTGTYWFTDLKQAYGYPAYNATAQTRNGVQKLDGRGATIAILMSSDVLDSDIEAMFTHEKFKEKAGLSANPKLAGRVAVDGGATTSSSALDEASLDVQQALGGAPGANVILYTVPDLSDTHIIDGYTKIINDNKADVVSSSFGGCELFYTAAYNEGVDQTQTLNLEHELFLQGNAQGITFLASSGDESGLECPNLAYLNGENGQFVPSVSTPAADPNVTAVGGTNLVTASSTGSLSSAYLRENAYADPESPYDPDSVGANASGGYWGAGGGVSTIFAAPSYQSGIGINTGSTSNRALPDIGMQVGGCPGLAETPCNGGNTAAEGNGNSERSSVVVYIQGQPSGLIGTSVASPEFSSVVALLVEKSGRQGNLNSYIYQLGHKQSLATSSANAAFHRSIPGYNGVVTNSQPKQSGNAYFNYTVGNGTPIVKNFIGAYTTPAAGAPQSATNP